MTQWPNWVDLVIVTIFLRACYSGFGRGLWSELLTLAGAVTATVLTVNFHETITGWLRPLLAWFGPKIGVYLAYYLLFLILIVLVHLVLRLVGDILRWERLHWSIQGLGMILGGVRGLWWAGFLLGLMASSGFAYLQQSATQDSLLGPRLEELATRAITQVANRFPGAGHRVSLFPQVK